jgi:CHAD domain-containing protein
MVEALDGLADRYSGQLPQQTFTVIREHLDQLGHAPRQSLMDANLTGQVAEELRAVRLRTADWRLKRGGWKAVKPGLKREYRRGRKAFRQAQADPTTERLHEWRKRAKDHWYHLRLLQSIAPRTIKGQAKDAHLLSDLLGDDHDLALLRDQLRDPGPAFAVDIEPVLALLGHRRAQLQRQAMLLGDRLYAEKPRPFVRRIGAYWKAWRAEARTTATEHPAELAELAELTRQPAGTAP